MEQKNMERKDGMSMTHRTYEDGTSHTDGLIMIRII